MCVCVYIYMCVCIYIYIHIHTHIYTHAPPEKNLFTKFIQVYTPNFLWDTFCHRGKRVKADMSTHQVP